VVRGGEHFGVALGGERGTVIADQLRPQFPVVVDLAVEQQRPPALFRAVHRVVNGLAALVAVDDRQTLETECQTGTEFNLSVIRTAMIHQFECAGESGGRRIVRITGTWPGTDENTQATHGNLPFVRSRRLRIRRVQNLGRRL
jgi:hypothetical protein